MFFKLLIPFTLAAVIGVCATPVFDFPDVVHRDDIPAGITVHEYNTTAAALGAAAAPKLDSRSSWEEQSNCKGSGSCWGYVNGKECSTAVQKYDTDAYYCGYTSRIFISCTAIFRCYEGYAMCARGGILQEMFRRIYTVQGCRRCGSVNIPVKNPPSITPAAPQLPVSPFR